MENPKKSKKDVKVSSSIDTQHNKHDVTLVEAKNVENLQKANQDIEKSIGVIKQQIKLIDAKYEKLSRTVKDIIEDHSSFMEKCESIIEKRSKYVQYYIKKANSKLSGLEEIVSIQNKNIENSDVSNEIKRSFDEAFRKILELR